MRIYCQYDWVSLHMSWFPVMTSKADSVRDLGWMQGTSVNTWATGLPDCTMSIKEGITFFSSGWVWAGNCSPFNSLNPATCTSLSQKLAIISRIVGINSCKAKMHLIVTNPVPEQCELYMSPHIAINLTQNFASGEPRLPHFLFGGFQSQTLKLFIFNLQFGMVSISTQKFHAHCECWCASQFWKKKIRPWTLTKYDKSQTWDLMMFGIHLEKLYKTESDLNKEELSSESGLINWGSGLQMHRPRT